MAQFCPLMRRQLDADELAGIRRRNRVARSPHPTVLDDDVLTFGIAQLAQPLSESLNGGQRSGSNVGSEITDARYLRFIPTDHRAHTRNASHRKTVPPSRSLGSPAWRGLGRARRPDCLQGRASAGAAAPMRWQSSHSRSCPPRRKRWCGGSGASTPPRPPRCHQLGAEIALLMARGPRTRYTVMSVTHQHRNLLRI
jgi:hypothetical protein